MSIALAWRMSCRNPASGEAIDKGLVIFFPAPESFTREDYAEFHAMVSCRH